MYVLGKYITHIFNDKFRIVRMEKKISSLGLTSITLNKLLKSDNI